MKSRVATIKRRHTKVVKLGKKNYAVRLVINQQSFMINSGYIETLKQANWHARMLAIALERFKGAKL